jgi:hypothetical protein
MQPRQPRCFGAAFAAAPDDIDLKMNLARLLHKTPAGRDEAARLFRSVLVPKPDHDQALECIFEDVFKSHPHQAPNT